MFTNIPPAVRAILYWIWIGAYLLILAAGLILDALGNPPGWLGPLSEWFLLIGVAVGFVAASNTDPVVVDPTALPPRARKVIYTVLAALQLVVFLGSQGWRLIIGGDPWWIDAANGILLILGTAFGFTAASHVVPNPPPADKAQPERAAGGVV